METIKCPYCGEFHVGELKISLWDVHKSVIGIYEYCPRCGKFMNLIGASIKKSLGA